VHDTLPTAQGQDSEPVIFKIVPTTANKHTAKTAKQPKARVEPGLLHTITPSTDKKAAGPKAFQKYKAHCC